MKRNQSRIPRQWLIVAERNLDVVSSGIRRLPAGAGVLIMLGDLPPVNRQRLQLRIRMLGRTKGLAVVDEGSGLAVRVHNRDELRRALLKRTPLVLLSPIHPTRSHPGLPPLPLMRAAALARLAQRRLIALGGMDERRFAQIAALGFRAWAGIDAFRT